MKKVSIISPCFNGESYIKPHIEAILAQEYKNLEYIFVNDGSFDKTEEIILSYEQKFKENDINFVYLKQENKGQAAAINFGLTKISGDYFSCIDSDDVLSPTFASDMSAYLDSHKDINICFPKAEIVEENSMAHLAYIFRALPSTVVDTLFEDFLMCKDNIPFLASYMLRLSQFKKIYPDMKIYEGKSGQNIQLILPFIYNQKVGYVDKFLIKRVLRKHSDSNGLDYNEKLIKFKNWEDICCQTLKFIPNMLEYEKGYYFTKIKDYFSQCRLEMEESNLEVSLHKKIKNSDKCILWGASLFLHNFIKKYNFNYKNVIGIIDTDKNKEGLFIDKLEILSPEILKDTKIDEIIITIVKQKDIRFTQIQQYLQDNNLTHIKLSTI